MNKSKLSKKLGISRPTLDKYIKDGSKNPKIQEMLNNTREIENQKLCIKLSAQHRNISPESIESILEFLTDYTMLNKKGVDFAYDYWSLFIKE